MAVAREELEEPTRARIGTRVRLIACSGIFRVNGSSQAVRYHEI